MIRDANAQDGAEIAAIYNDAVLHSTAIWDEAPVDAQDRSDWIAERQAAGFPVLVYEAEGRVAGYASYGTFRAKSGYRQTVEHSVYVRADIRGGGIGIALMEAIIARAKAQKLHVMVAAIEASNTGSIRLHQKLGFEKVGLMPQVGQKFGRWLDLALLQLLLDGHEKP